MSTSDSGASSILVATPNDAIDSFVSEILRPGSSLHPKFLRVLDAAFVFLLVVFLGLLLATGSVHIVVLLIIELALWASVKWFVHELRQTTLNSDNDNGQHEQQAKTKED